MLLLSEILCFLQTDIILIIKYCYGKINYGEIHKLVILRINTMFIPQSITNTILVINR